MVETAILSGTVAIKYTSSYLIMKADSQEPNYSKKERCEAVRLKTVPDFHQRLCLLCERFMQEARALISQGNCAKPLRYYYP